MQLLSQQDLSREQQEYVEIANERINALKMLLDQLFEFARIEANELKLNKKILILIVLCEKFWQCFTIISK
ncbi:hypothetical protein ACIL82_11135 [Enterococcus faecium]